MSTSGGELRGLRTTPSDSLGKLRMDKFNSHQRLGRQWILPTPACDNFFQSWKCREENILEKCDIQNSKCEIWKAGFSWKLEFVFHVSALMSYLKSFRVILSFSEQKPCSNTNTLLSRSRFWRLDYRLELKFQKEKANVGKTFLWNIKHVTTFIWTRRRSTQTESRKIRISEHFYTMLTQTECCAWPDN